MKTIVFVLLNLCAISAYAAEQADAASTAAAATTSAALRVKLPLDHGPRAQSTPWLNQQTRQRIARQQQQQLAQSAQSTSQGVAQPAASVN